MKPLEQEIGTFANKGGSYFIFVFLMRQPLNFLFSIVLIDGGAPQLMNGAPLQGEHCNEAVLQSCFSLFTHSSFISLGPMYAICCTIIENGHDGYMHINEMIPALKKFKPPRQKIHIHVP